MHCDTQGAALAEIARRSGGYLRVRPAAQLLIDSGLTESEDLDVAGATVDHRMRKGKDWEYHDAGVYRFLPFFSGGASGDG